MVAWKPKEGQAMTSRTLPVNSSRVGWERHRDESPEAWDLGLAQPLLGVRALIPLGGMGVRPIKPYLNLITSKGLALNTITLGGRG